MEKSMQSSKKMYQFIFLCIPRYFTWDSGKFPSSVDMINGVAAKGRKVLLCF